jgi:glucan endo-1,3-alpha-glucosidase
MQDNLKFLEIVTWNDYGESHYIGPYDTPHTDDGSSRYTKGLDHTAHLEFAVPYIKAFKSGSRTPVIEQDMLVYWYRPHLKSASCDATDNVGSKPDGWDMVADEVFVATMTKNGGSFTATSGGNGGVTHEAAAGVQIFRIPMGVGEQKFTFTAGGQSEDGTSSIPISADCWNGVYNFNYHSGSIKL